MSAHNIRDATYVTDTLRAAKAAGLPEPLTAAVLLHSADAADARARFETATEISALGKILGSEGAFANLDRDALSVDWIKSGFTAAEFRAEATRAWAEYDEATHTDGMRPEQHNSSGDHFAARAAHTKAMAERQNHV